MGWGTTPNPPSLYTGSGRGDRSVLMTPLVSWESVTYCHHHKVRSASGDVTKLPPDGLVDLLAFFLLLLNTDVFEIFYNTPHSPIEEKVLFKSFRQLVHY